MLLQEELFNQVIVSFRVNKVSKVRKYLGTDSLLRYLESYEDVFSPLIYKNKAGESYTKMELITLVEFGKIKAYDFEGEDDERPEAKYTNCDDVEIGFTNAMAESGVGYADIGDWHYYSLPLHTLNFKNYEEELMLILDVEPHHAEEFFTYVVKPEELTSENAIALAELCNNDVNSKFISPVLKEYVKSELPVKVPDSNFNNEEWEEILTFVKNSDTNGLIEFINELLCIDE